jgi:hypothetical protein
MSAMTEKKGYAWTKAKCPACGEPSRFHCDPRDCGWRTCKSSPPHQWRESDGHVMGSDTRTVR